MDNIIKKGFTNVPDALVNDVRLTRDARFLYVYLAYKKQSEKFTNADIESGMNFTNETRIKYIKELVKYRWIKVIKKRDKYGRFIQNEIMLNTPL
jgi:hypothetical protein